MEIWHQLIEFGIHVRKTKNK